MRHALSALLLPLLALTAGAAPLSGLTPAERQWIDEHRVVEYVFNPRATPYTFEEQGKHRGVDADLLELVSERTGLRFVPRMVPWPESLALVERGEVPLVSQAAITPERGKFLLFTEPVLELRYGIFTHVRGPFVESVRDLEGLRVAIPRGFVIEERLRREAPGLQLETFERISEGMARLATGEFDAVVVSVGAGTYGANVRGLSNLRLRGMLPEVYRFAMGISRKEPLLHSILQKALADIPPEQMRDLKNRWIGMPGPGFTREEMVAIAASAAAIVALFAAMNIGFLYLRLRTRHRQLAEAEKRMEQLATVDDLTALGNRRAYIRTIEAELGRAAREWIPLGFLELDLDHFKDINDTHGHNAGDRALVAVGQAIGSELRLYDSAFRTGGEEFVVLLPATDTPDAERVAERLRRRIETLPGLGHPLTASIGCAVLPAGRAATSDELFAAADAALYRAKAEGRNCVRFTKLDAVPGHRPVELQNG